MPVLQKSSFKLVHHLLTMIVAVATFQSEYEPLVRDYFFGGDRSQNSTF